MEFRLLGVVEVRDGAGLVNVGGRKPWVLLATLLLEHNRVVSAQRLVDAIWGSNPPPSARSLVQTYVAGLRRAFSGRPSLIATRGPGYMIQTDPAELDLWRFEQLTGQAREAVRAYRFDDAAELFDQAVSLWRGPALSGLDSELLASEAARLDELRLVVQEERIAVNLLRQRHTELVAELTGLVRSHPTREVLRGHLMVALYRSGRQADALEIYREGREILVEQLGIEPGATLQTVHEAILRGDEALLPAPYVDGLAELRAVVPGDETAPAKRPVTPAGPVPAQLPAAVADFTGRENERRELWKYFTAPGAVALPTVVITGPGGVGKSTLAVRVGHDLAPSYPDGQLFVQLHGATTTPTMPDAVLARFLSALGDSDGDLPSTLEERSERYRSLVAGRRLLVVLDDAANEAQVRPLLPGSSSCGVLITSRSRLSGLAGAHPLELDVLPSTEALDLLASIVGRQRIDAEAVEARRLVQQCGGLALAVRIVGTRLVDRRHWTVSTLVRRLEQEQRRLDELRVGDQEVRASIALSYASLDARARAAARRLGLMGLPDFPSWILAPLLDTDPAAAEAVLERLLDAQFVRYSRTDEVGQVRYQMHDLIRLFTSERALVEDEPGHRVEAVRRVLSGWQRVVEHIGEAYPSGGLGLDSSSAGAAESGGRAQGMDMSAVIEMARERPRAWFSAEQHALIASIERAAALDLDHEAARLAVALAAAVFSSANFFEAWSRTHDVALDVVRRTGNRAAEAGLLNGLGQLRYEQDRFAEARTYYMQALAAFREMGDARGEAVTLAATGAACREQGYLPEALHFLTQARDLLRTLHDPAALASVSRLTGTVLLEQGDLAGAHAALRDALTAFRGLGGRRGEALTLRTIGLVHRAEGDYARAYELSAQARAIFREIGDDLFEAYSVQAMVKAQVRLGRWVEAADPLLEALGVCRTNADRYGEALCLRTLGELHLVAENLSEADEYLQAALRLWRLLDLPLPRARTLRDLARLAVARGDLDSARSHLTEAEEITRLYGAREHAELVAALAEL